MNDENKDIIPNICTIAGSDSGGGAGIQADLKAISACGGYGCSAITALTAQNTMGVHAVSFIEPNFIAAQIKAILDDIFLKAIKIGMIGPDEAIEAVASSLENLDIPIILDPVMVAKGGDRLLPQEAVNRLKSRLLPLATIITPNLPEASWLLGDGFFPAKTRDDMQNQAMKLIELMGQNHKKAVFLKGGHLQSDESPDLLLINDHGRLKTHWLEGKRLNAKHTHGTGCSLSSAMATFLAKGHELQEACRLAKAYIVKSMEGADKLNVGKGIGPLNHFHL